MSPQLALSTSPPLLRMMRALSLSKHRMGQLLLKQVPVILPFTPGFLAQPQRQGSFLPQLQTSLERSLSKLLPALLILKQASVISPSTLVLLERLCEQHSSQELRLTSQELLWLRRQLVLLILPAQELHLEMSQSAQDILVL